ncbi:MAG: hypothetical protein IH997_03305 [Proteobacteria bacterium]|nr:hypothetical protein [Pseudomonadota bacterium]
MQLSKVILNPQIAKENQHVKVGTICLLAGSPLDFGSTERTASYERFERLFAEVMKAKGFSVQEKSANLFEENSSGESADFLMGATFQPASVTMCDSVNGQKGAISISVEWQIYDRTQKKVVEIIKSAGKGERAKFDQDGLNGMINDAFKDSLNAMVDQGKVQKYLGAPTPH